MLLESETPLVAGGGKNSPGNAIGTMSRSGGLGWACFSQRHSGNSPDEDEGAGVGEGVDVGVIGLWAGRRRGKQ
jgi:hypothetical protein